MDVDMDIDLGPLEAPDNVQPVWPLASYRRIALTLEQLIDLNQTIAKEIAAQEMSIDGTATAHKVHIRGLDDLTTADIKAFSSEHFPSHLPVRVEWIDDTSANIVFETPAIGMLALEQLSVAESSSLPALQLRPAKPLLARPEVSLQVRCAVATDQKQARAHESSRFYLLYPEHDPREQRRRERGRDNNEYRRRRYGHDENRRRRRKDRTDRFDASMYDDDNESISHRSSIASSSDGRSRRPRRMDSYRPGSRSFSRGRSASPGADRSKRRRRTPPPAFNKSDPTPFPSANTGKELFPTKNQDDLVKEGKDLFSDRLISRSPKELFPTKVNTVIHRRTDAFDAADETADLFSSRMSVPFVDGAANRVSRGIALGNRISLAKSIKSENRPSSALATMPNSDDIDQGVSIRGVSTPEISIRGVAKLKELFPDKVGSNVGKELFAEKVNGRGGRRNRAEDMF